MLFATWLNWIVIPEDEVYTCTKDYTDYILLEWLKNSKFKRQVGIEFNSATKSKETRNKILGRENILAWDDL